MRPGSERAKVAPSSIGGIRTIIKKRLTRWGENGETMSYTPDIEPVTEKEKATWPTEPLVEPLSTSAAPFTRWWTG